VPRPVGDQIVLVSRTTTGRDSEVCRAVAQPGGRGARPPPRNWVYKKIPGCAVELSTQYRAWFGSQISLITAMSFREAMPPPEPPTSGSAPGPLWGSPFPRPPVPPTSKSWLRH